MYNDLDISLKTKNDGIEGKVGVQEQSDTSANPSGKCWDILQEKQNKQTLTHCWC